MSPLVKIEMSPYIILATKFLTKELRMKEVIKMDRKTLERVKILEMIKQKKLSQKEGCEFLKLSKRQLIRIYKKYLEGGEESLNHGLRGKTGNHRIDESYKKEVIECYKTYYKGFGPTFASELMYENNNLIVKAGTLRLWLMDEGLWEKKKKMPKHRLRRARKKYFGEMIQMDGSIHDWFGDGKKVCLMNMVDDGTGKSYGLFDSGETTNIALRCLYDWIKENGIPYSLYTDYRSIFYTDRETTLEEQLEGEEALTEFGKVCKKLGIEIIFANSPQAKGRVERHNGIHQDRLLKLLKLKGIKNCEEANEFLKKYYWDSYNKKFSKKPESDEDMHVPLVAGQNLDEIICYCDKRKISRDYVVKKDNRIYQLTKKQNINIKPGDKVLVKTWLDNSVHIYKDRIELNYYELDERGNKLIS